MKTNGFTLIEMATTLVVLSLLGINAVGMINSYLLNSRISSTAGELREGIFLAKSEAIKRNTAVDFRVTNTGWQIWMPWVDNTKPYLTREAAQKSITVAGVDANGDAVTTIEFIGSGRPNSAITSAPVTIDITPNAPLACRTADSGEVTCLRVLVTSGGKVRVCNPTSENELFRCPTA